jgi:hypothetical protein
MTRRDFGWSIALGLSARAVGAETGEISLGSLGESCLEVERAFEGAPDADGILKQYVIRLPHFEVATHYAAFQRHNLPRKPASVWPDGTNRVQPLPVRDFQNLRAGGMFLLLKLEATGYLAVLPVTGARTIAWFSSSGPELLLNLGTLGTGAVHGDLPLVAWARSASPYDAARQAWETAIHHPLVGNTTRMRAEKSYPKAFRYLGWCSWEEYKGSINEQILVDAMDAIEESGLPIRWVLVDDGHLDEQGRQLLSFRPNAKFPHGWGPLVSRRKPDKIRWMGLWLNFNGYWNGISPKNNLGALNEHLAPQNTALQPKAGSEDSFVFYDAMVGTARRAGFDFVKVDNQAKNLALYSGSPRPVASASANAKALELACAFHMDGLINCMAHGPVSLFNTRVSAVTRCSEDYQLADRARAKRHFHNSYGNMLWLGQTVWGDHDMFHSGDPVAGRMMAVSRALSGGPVYLSDNPRKCVAEHIRPLCFNDGELLRVLAPAVPLPESIFVDPFDEPKPFRAIAPLPGGAAAVVVYNLTDPELAISGYVEPQDYREANGLIQPRSGPWELPAESVVLYDWYEKRAQFLSQKFEFAMPKFGDRLLLLCPIQDGWAVIGRTDKYLSPAGVEILEATTSELVLKMRESGPLVIWQRDGEAGIHSPDCKFRRVAKCVWQADVTDAEGLIRVRK